VAIVGNGYNNQSANQAVLYVINLLDGTRKASVSTTSPQAVSGRQSERPLESDGRGRRPRRPDRLRVRRRHQRQPVEVRPPQHRVADGHEALHDEPAQPITGRPTVSLHPLGGYMVNFATGRMFTSADAADATTVYYAYGLRDNGTAILDSNIVSQTLTGEDLDLPPAASTMPCASARPMRSTMARRRRSRAGSSRCGRRARGGRRWRRDQPALHLRVDEPDGGARRNRRRGPGAGDNWLNEVDLHDRRRRHFPDIRPGRQPFVG
jgi:hypothetical protein